MSIPDNRLSTVTLPAPFLVSIPRDHALVDFEMGGVGLQNPSQGLNVQLWRLRYDELTGNFLLSAPNHPETILFNRPNVSYISLSFDSNMNLFVSFTQAGVSRFWWFDTVPSAQVFDEVTIATATSPYATLDDRRILQDATRDILLFYIRIGNLFFRQQRDRYTIEYLLQAGVTGDVLKAGMQTNLRVGILLGSF
ncbi:MAG: hypothetical protein DDT31_01419 [Syntrophomonadaceae bacterium]|nr:hypothetical protein [Bacillota bacterium]